MFSHAGSHYYVRTYGNDFALTYAFNQLYTYTYMYIAGNIIEGPSNVTYIPGRTPLPIVQICNVTGFPGWRINGTLRSAVEFLAGIVYGHNISGANILINVPMNDTEYVCTSNAVGVPAVVSPPAFLYIAGEYVYAHIGMGN